MAVTRPVTTERYKAMSSTEVNQLTAEERAGHRLPETRPGRSNSSAFDLTGLDPREIARMLEERRRMELDVEARQR